MELSPLDALNLGDGTRLGEVPSLQGLDLSRLANGEPARGKARQYVRFYHKEVPEVYATEVEIVPLGMTGTTSTRVKKTDFRMVKKEFVQIKTPGDKDEYDNVVFPHHIESYFPLYQAFKSGKTVPTGQQLEDVEFLAGVPSIVTELRVKGCHTIEQLADASDLLCSVIPDGYLYREYARTFVKSNASQSQNQVISALQAQVQELTQKLTQLVDSKGQPMTDDVVAVSKKEALKK